MYVIKKKKNRTITFSRVDLLTSVRLILQSKKLPRQMSLEYTE